MADVILWILGVLYFLVGIFTCLSGFLLLHLARRSVETLAVARDKNLTEDQKTLLYSLAFGSARTKIMLVSILSIVAWPLTLVGGHLRRKLAKKS